MGWDALPIHRAFFVSRREFWTALRKSGNLDGVSRQVPVFWLGWGEFGEGRGVTTSNGAAIARQMRWAWEAGPIRDLNDGQLLDLFNSGRADRRELAFTALVERHGPMVRAVARGIFGSRPDVDDAFQATFLVLTRKAADLTVRDTVGPWMFQVARRCALAARRAEARRRRLDLTVVRPSESDEPDTELAGIVHEEVTRLPDRDRAVVVLCDLEGESLDAAARVLGCPVGTVKSRLSRARNRLRRGLQRRGLDGSLLIPPGLAPALPTSLIDLATDAAIRFAAWSPLAASVAAHLARGVIQTMTWNRWLQSAATVLGTTLVISVGSAWLAAGETPPDLPRVQTPPPAQAARPELATVTVVPELKPQVIDGQANAVPPPGVDVNVAFEFPARVLSVSPPGLKVKKGDVLYRLDSALITEGIAKLEGEIKTLQNEFQAAQVRLSEEQAKVEAARKRREDQRREAEATQIQAEQGVVDRAEARVKRYREASELAGRLAIDPGDPKLLPALVARLELMDRLDSAETDLDLKRKQFEQICRTIRESQPSPPPDEPISKAVGEATENLRVKRENLGAAVERKRRAERSLQQCTILSPADGTIASDGFGEQTVAGQLQPQIAPKTNPGVGSLVYGSYAICRVLTSAHPEKEIALLVPSSGFLRHLKPNDTVLFRAIRDSSGFNLEGPALSGEFVELIMLDVFGNPLSPTDKRMRQEAARFRLDTPVDLSPARTAHIEFRVELPTGQVRVPARALAGDRVAVKQPDGRFQWRTVELAGAMDADNQVYVRKPLAVGETVALDPWAAMGETPPKKDERPLEIKSP